MCIAADHIAHTLEVLTGHNYHSISAMVRWRGQFGLALDLWFGREKGLTLMQRRILTSNPLDGDVWEILCWPEYEHPGKRCTGRKSAAWWLQMDLRIRKSRQRIFYLYQPANTSYPLLNLSDNSTEEDEDYTLVFEKDQNEQDDEGDELLDEKIAGV